jgi:hypothetical protein
MSLAGELELFSHRVGEQEATRILWHVAYVPNQLVYRCRLGVEAMYEHTAAGRVKQADQVPEQGRLARSISPHQGDQFALSNSEIKATQGSRPVRQGSLI